MKRGSDASLSWDWRVGMREDDVSVGWEGNGGAGSIEVYALLI